MGPESRVVYLRRRAAVVGAAVLAVVAVIWLVGGHGGTTADSQSVQAAAASTSSSSTAPAIPTAPPTTSVAAAAPSAGPATSSSPRPTSPVVGPGQALAAPDNAPQVSVCSDAAVDVTTQVGAPTYSVGTEPVFRLLVTNIGKQPCTDDLSGHLQQVLVYSADGTQRVWSSNDCFPGTSADLRVLAVGQPAVYNVQWAGTTSAEGCRAPRVQVGPGEYIAMAVLGSQQSQPVPFTLA